MKLTSDALHISIDALWDETAEVWSASSKDVFGLFVEAGSIDQLLEQIALVFGDLQTDCTSLTGPVVFQISCRKEKNFLRQFDLKVEHAPKGVTA